MHFATPQPFLALLVSEYCGGRVKSPQNGVLTKKRSALFFLEQGEAEADGELPDVKHAKDCT